MTDNQTDWQWHVGDSDEEYHTSASSRDEAVQIAQGLGGAYIIEARKVPLRLAAYAPDAELILEHAEDRAIEVGGEEPIFAPDKKQTADLDASIKAAIEAWQNRHNLTFMPWCFTESRNSEWIDEPADAEEPS